MKESEKLIDSYLSSRGFSSVVYEPDGNVTPDFLVDGRIAVEVRRLNENHETTGGHCGLEDVSKKLNALMLKTLPAMGPPTHGESWLVSYSYRRPLPQWRELERLLTATLQAVRDRVDLMDGEVCVTRKFRLHFMRAGRYPSLFVLAGEDDCDSGGFVVSEMARNLRICIAEKTSKISKVRGRYPEWWLALDDRIGYGMLDEADRKLLRELIRPYDAWSKIILVNPLQPTNGFEL